MPSLNDPKSRWYADRSTRAALVVIVLYLALVIWRYDSIPPTLSTDTVAEVETGYRLIESGQFKVMAFDPHFVGAETLWISITGVLIHLFGHTVFAALAMGWIGAMLLLLSLVFFARRSAGRIDPLILVLTAISTIWLFHYARTGYRVIGSVMFFSLTLSGMMIFLRDGGRGWRGPALLGGSMALGLYCYTSSRIAPIGYVIFALGHLAWVFRSNRLEFRRWFGAHARVCLIALIISIPNIVYAAREPEKYFGRGIQYNLRGTPDDWARYVVQSFLTPLAYENHAYGDVGTDRWLFDPVAVTLPVAGISSVSPLVGIAALVGLILIFRRERGAALGVAIFGLLCYILTCTLIGFTGPSLTRLFINFPLVIISAGLALTLLARRLRLSLWISLALVALMTLGMIRYVNAMNDPRITSLYAPAAREIIDETLARNHLGQNVLVVLRRRVGVFRYYVHKHPAVIYLVDFTYPAKYDRRLIEEHLGQSDVVIIEDDEFFSDILTVLERSPRFIDVTGEKKLSHLFERVKAGE